MPTSPMRLMARVSDAVALRPPVAIALFWVAVLLIELLDWGAGIFKATVMAAMLLVLAALTSGIGRRQPSAAMPPERHLAMAVGALVAAQIAFALLQVWDPHIIDIPGSVLEAGRALLAGNNPYTSMLDHTVSGSSEADPFRGFKYSPLMAVAYMPLGIPLGDRGVILTNLALQLATACLVFRLGRTDTRRATGLMAALAYLMLVIGPWELFHQGVPDLAAVLPLLIALLYVDRSAMLTGFGVGISLSVKLLPAGVMLPCCLPTSTRDRTRYVLGIALGTVPLMVAEISSPTAVWNNLVEFNLSRPADSTSWLYWAPHFMSPVVRGIGLIVILCIVATAWRARTMTVATRCGLGAIAILATLLTGPVAHNNYQLWWLPLASVVLAVSLDRAAAQPVSRHPQ